MKYINKFNEGTVSDRRDTLSRVTKEIHKHNSKEFYVVSGNIAVGESRYVEKLIIPEKYRGEFKEEYDNTYGFFKDTAEYIEMIATESGGSMVIMDYEIEDFIKTLQDVVKEPGEEIE